MSGGGVGWRANKRSLRPGLGFQEADGWNKTKLQSKIQIQAFSYVNSQATRFAGNQISRHCMPEGQDSCESTLLVGTGFENKSETG